MATSGSFNTSKVGNFYFTFDWYRTGYNSSNNEHYIHYTVTAHNTPGNYRTVYLKSLVINNSNKYYNTSGTSYHDGNVVTSGDMTIASYNNEGDGSISASFEAGVGTTSGANSRGSGSWNIDRIPRYANITSFSVSKIDETRVKFNWSTDVACDYSWYSTNNGSNWYNLPSNNIITGLSAGTSYNFKIKVRRADNHLESVSGTYTESTYDNPHITEVVYANIIIGQSQTLNLYNPLNRNITIKMNKDNASGTELYSSTTSGTSLTFTPDSETLYESIPNDKTGNCVYSVIYGSSTRTTAPRTYTIDVNESKPIFTNFEYSTNLSELTGNNDTIVNGETTTTFTISLANKATAKNSASIYKYRLECGNLKKEVTYSSSSAVVASLQGCTNQVIKVTAIDSRGIETVVQKTITYFRAYSKPSFSSISTVREDNIDTKTYLNFVVTYWNGSFGLNNNTISAFKYRVRELNSQNWSNYFSGNPSYVTTSSGKATLENYLIHEDGTSGGFTAGKSYVVEVVVYDGILGYELSSVTTTSTILDGKVAISILQDSNGEYHIGINGMPDLNETLKVYGTISSNS